MAKPRNESRTLLFNKILMTFGVFLSLLVSQDSIRAAIPEWVYGLIIAVSGAIGYYLRLDTKEAVAK